MTTKSGMDFFFESCVGSYDDRYGPPLGDGSIEKLAEKAGVTLTMNEPQTINFIPKGKWIMTDEQKERLKSRLVDMTCNLTKLKDDKKAMTASYNEQIKHCTEKCEAIAAAAKEDNLELLKEAYDEEEIFDLLGG